MFCKGEYRNDKKAYGVICSHTKRTFEAMLINNGVVESAYKKDETGEYAFGNVVAKEMATTLLLGIRGCTSKNGNAMAFELGVLTQHEFIKTRVDYLIQLSAGELCGCDISGENQHIELLYDKNIAFPSGVEYIKLTTSSKKDISVADGDDVIVRSVNEIALEKDDITWLKNKKYYIVNDDEKAEQIFSYLDNYDGVIAYDTETTGLRINCFGKINSSYQRELEQYNKEHPNEQLRADKLVGIIYCIEPNVSYYFPCGNRKFKNLYDDKESPIRKRLIEQIKAKYTVGELRDSDGDMADYVRKTAPEDFTSDVILMERNRHILTTKHIVPHGGSFEWKVGWLYEIDTNIKDDTMILHQIMYKFRSTTRNSGEPSNLKYLAKVELGIDQWELNDFFPDFKEDDGGEIRVKAGSRKKKQNSKIDFSYMDYEGTKVYAPTDGDVTLQLLLRYKKDMIENHPEQVYIYNVEVLVECAIGYMEFYGHRINEDKILGVRDRTKAKIVKIESEIRQIANYSSTKELEKYNELVKLINDSESDPDNKEILKSILKATEELRDIINNDEEHPLNLASPAQVADLFYVKMGIPFKSGEKMSVAKGQLKGLLKERNEDGSPKYPIVHLYSDYKKEDTLVTKFFDNLPYFMYPGGLIFSHYGQISTATGRMSCIEENTLISVVGGDKKIKDIKVGDLVYCYDNDGNLKARKVTKVIDNGYKECIKLNWRSQGTHKEGELICTPDHRILTKDAGWVQAQDLQYGDRVYHLRKSKEDRPRLFGANGLCEQEQLFIKREIFGCTGYNNVIHHKNEKTSDNDLSNLEIKSRAEHSSEHSKKLVASGRIKYEHLLNYEKPVLRGENHPNYIKKSIEELANMLLEADGVLTKVGMDFGTYKKKCDEVGLDYKGLMGLIRREYKEVSKDEFIDSFYRNNGTVYAISKDLDIGRTRVENLINLYNLRETKDLGISNTDYTKIYFECKGDLDKLEQITQLNKKDLRELNKQLNLVYTGISDDEFIKEFMANNGSIRSTAKSLGITFYKASLTVKRLNLCYNHKIIGQEHVGIKHVYDLEVEELHNFIAGEVCVHNCNKPNAQQYPKAITGIVEPRDGYVMMDADYSQIEYRVLVAMSNNSKLAELFSDPDSDYHTLMASQMYGVPYASVTPKMRGDAKSFNFGIPYGMGLGSLAILLTGVNNQRTRDEAAEKYELYFKDQPMTRKFFDQVKEMAQVKRYTKTFWNRYRYYSFTDADGNENNAKKAAALRQAGNAVIQGCLHGDTRIQTKEFGILKIKDLVGYSGEVWNGEKWTHGDVLYSGKKRKCIITFSNGQKFICSPIHKFLQAGKNPNDENNYIECRNLKHGDSIAVNRSSELSVDIPKEIEEKYNWFCSTLSGDGDETAIDSPLCLLDFHVESVEITDEYIDMYDVCNTDEGYYVADGIITHNTAADIFKISVARNFMYIRENNLLGDLLIVNMVHDEQLMEVNVKKLNMQRILRDVGINMQFKINGFPPLYIGAGIGPAWGKAKGKMAEIHPNLLEQLSREADVIPLRHSKNEVAEPKDVLKYFEERVLGFRRQKVIDYITNPDNFHQTIHPAIGGLINLQFNYGRGGEAKAYMGGKYTDEEFLLLNLGDFIAENNLDVKAEWFKAMEAAVDEEEDEEYDEREDGELDEIEDEKSFSLVDESNKFYGSSLQDIISIFGTCVLDGMNVCGIDMRNIYYKKKDAIIDYIATKVCDESDSNALEVVYLLDGNVLNHTGVYVSGLNASKLEGIFKANNNTLA